jgi:uncharacterized phage protein (TIGR01671 family)
MNREIKFRTWSYYRKCFVKGLMWSSETHEISQLRGISKDGASYNCDEHVEFMQFTGLKDKTGKEIYEGDIVEGIPIMRSDDTKLRGFVFFDKRGIWKVQIPGFNDEQDIEYLSEICRSNEPEVIGNIFENIELLKRIEP